MFIRLPSPNTFSFPALCSPANVFLAAMVLFPKSGLNIGFGNLKSAFLADESALRSGCFVKAMAITVLIVIEPCLELCGFSW